MNDSINYFKSIQEFELPLADYLLSVLGFSLIIRLIATTLKSIEASHQEDEKFLKIWKANFKGYLSRKIDKKNKFLYSDYWFNFILGSIELFIYPFLIAVNAYQLIGAWIALKTIAQWKAWSGKRQIFNRFLIGTALSLIFAFLMALWYF